jgi:hypothetical protein
LKHGSIFFPMTVFITQLFRLPPDFPELMLKKPGFADQHLLCLFPSRLICCSV